MNLATVLGVTAVLEGAAALAGWAGGFTYAITRPAHPAPAWRHAAATTAAVWLAAYTYFAALTALGHGAVISGSEDTPPTLAGIALLAVVFALGAGVPWGLFRHADARAEAATGNTDSADMWPVTRRVSAWLFLPFAILGLAVFAPRANGDAAGTIGATLVGALLLVPLAAILPVVVRHRGPILELAGWGALAGIPLLTALLALGGLPLADAFIFTAASALVWAPVFGYVTWALTGMHEAGFRLRRDFLIVPSASARPPAARTDERTRPRPPREPRRTRRRNRRS